MIPWLFLPAGATLVAAAAVAFSIEPRAISAGERLYQQCTSCHSLNPDENLASGPTLHAIVGKSVAAEKGFDHSPALRRFARENPRWTPELLDRFIAEPEAVVPGTYMSFHGMADPAERAALIDYLKRR